ncbi:MAG: hypothetical protein H7345_08700 [Rubritepida sp.]|nr:hypothetical protein [Rubritepida sp.]
MAPARLPPPLRAGWNGAVRAALATPDMRRQLAQDGSEPMGGTPEEFRAFLDGEHAR